MRTKMTPTEINRKMAEIAGEEWHEPVEGSVFKCKTCNAQHLGPVMKDNLDYTDNKNLHLVREVELKLVEEGLGDKYACNVNLLLKETTGYNDLMWLNFITADAKTRCLAIIKTCTQVEKERNDNTEED